MRHVFLLIIALAAGLVACAQNADAHEIGETRVFLNTTGPDWHATIITAPTPLLNRLELHSGQLPSRDLQPEELERRLTAMLPMLGEHLRVSFDDVPVAFRSTIDLQVPADITVPTQLALRLDGTAPAGASMLQWTFDLTASRYALSFNDRVYWLDGGQPGPQMPIRPEPAPSAFSIFLDYIRLGFVHIIPAGPDHVLFVLGLVFGAAGFRRLAVQVTAFTVAHSVTLFLAMEGIVSVSPAIVEPAIALSIAIVAAENLLSPARTQRTQARLAQFWRPALVFAFGLLHGLGFAGVLADLGLPPEQRLPALFGFNLGIETAQLLIVIVVHTLVLRHIVSRPWYRTRIVWPASVLIALTGLYWAVTRIFGG